MFELMCLHYDNIKYENFKNDLKEKTWVVLLKNQDKKIRGFSTQMLMDIEVNGLKIKGVFSGDTVIHKDYWGDLELSKVWLRFALTLKKQLLGYKVFWFLISKGYKTYRYLPIHFYSFYPRFDKETPVFEKKIMDTFGEAKYSGEYDPKTGVIHTKGEKDWLKEGVADITEKRLKDPHVKFFAEANPDWSKGDELVCITELAPENIKPSALRILLGDNYK